MDDEHVAIPMGLVALTWIRLYKPLLAANLPQSPQNHRGGLQLGFAKEAFGRLADLSQRDLRVGLRLTGDSGQALHQALRDVAATVRRMPAHYMTYPNSPEPILPVEAARAARYPGVARLDEPYLASFGTMRVPIHLWLAAQRFAAWDRTRDRRGMEAGDPFLRRETGAPA